MQLWLIACTLFVASLIQLKCLLHHEIRRDVLMSQEARASKLLTKQVVTVSVTLFQQTSIDVLFCQIVFTICRFS
jgi:putative effector of murein hydrolase